MTGDRAVDFPFRKSSALYNPILAEGRRIIGDKQMAMHKLWPNSHRADRWLKCLGTLVLAVCVHVAGCTAGGGRAWRHGGFEDFAAGRFDDGGSNLYVNAHGVIEIINRLDVNNDGYVDLVLSNSHDYIERGPTDVFWLGEDGTCSKRQHMSADSGWMSRIVDVDKDGFADLVVANGENGVTSELPSYVYWGTAKGLGAQRTDLATVGAYDVAVLDINRDGRLDLVFPSAWKDHHNPGKPMAAHVYLGGEGRKFTDATKRYGIEGVAAVGIAAADLNDDGHVDLVLANNRIEHDKNTHSFIYWGTAAGVDAKAPLPLPTSAAWRVLAADLNGDGREDVIFSGDDGVRIYWNRAGKFDPADRLIVGAGGDSAAPSAGAKAFDVADLDGDGHNDLVMVVSDGVQIRRGGDLGKVGTLLPLKHASWVTAGDLNNDGRPDLLVSRHQDGLTFDTTSPIYWNGPSGFSPERATWVATGGAVGNTCGDLDGDGLAELIFNNTMSGHVRGIHNYIYLGNKDAEYGVERRIELPTDAGNVAAIADVDLDGFPEVIFTEAVTTEGETAEGIRIHAGGPDGPSPGRSTFVRTNKTLQGVRVADFNRDGYLDLLVNCQVYDTTAEALAESGTIYYGSKAGFSESRRQSVPMYGNSSYAADVNNDGYLDLLFAEKRKRVLIYLGGEGGYRQDRTWQVPCPGLARAGSVITADINADGWADLIVATMGHYARLPDTLYIFYGSEAGYSPDRSQQYLGGYSPLMPSVADFNRDGNLDVLVTAYSSPTARVLPAQLFWGDGESVDFDHPVDLPANGSSDALQVDLNRDGWIDLFLVCHRNDIGHQVDSLIYWNSPEGFAPDRVTGLPGLGPHGCLHRDHGNAYTRKPQESYVSPAFDMNGLTAEAIHWEAEVPPPSRLRFQLRWAASKELLATAEWMGPGGDDSHFERSASRVRIPTANARWLQYRAIFISPYGCRSPRLRQVRVDLKPVK